MRWNGQPAAAYTWHVAPGGVLVVVDLERDGWRSVTDDAAGVVSDLAELRPVVFLAGSAAAAQPLRCPPGTAAWVDGWGNPTCRSLDTGESVLTAPNPRTGLPSGFVRSFDGWGNPAARSVGPDAGTSYLPTTVAHVITVLRYFRGHQL